MAHTDCGRCWENKYYERANSLEIKNILFLFKSSFYPTQKQLTGFFLSMTLVTLCSFANNNDAGLMSRMGNISTFSLAAQDCFPAEGMGG